MPVAADHLLATVSDPLLITSTIPSQELAKIRLRATHGGNFKMAEKRTLLLCVDTCGRFFLLFLFRRWDCKRRHVAVRFELKFCSAPYNAVRKKACDPYAEMQRVT